MCLVYPAKDWDLSGCPLLCICLVDDFIGRSFFLGSHCLSTIVNFWCQRVKSNNRIYEGGRISHIFNFLEEESLNS